MCIRDRYTTLQRSTLIEFLKDDIYTQHIRFGKRIKEISIDPGKPGKNFRTTLDLDVQKIASKLLEKNESKFTNFWKKIVGSGSNMAVNVSKLV